MLYIKFKGNQLAGFGEDDFKWFLSYMGMVAFLVIWPGPFWTNFLSSNLKMLYMKFGFQGPIALAPEGIWKYKSEWPWTMAKQ